MNVAPHDSFPDPDVAKPMSHLPPSSTIKRFIQAVFPSLAKIIHRWNAFRLERRHWNERIADVLACPDNVRLPRVKHAGKILNGYQIMHNGLEVAVDGYYGHGVTRMLRRNRGCHEPQEEVVFDAIVRTLPPGSVMIEAGAYWAFYSLWFCQAVTGARVFLIEPAVANLATGRANFSRNHFTGEFTQAYVGATSGIANNGIPILALDQFTTERALTHINVLHADIQGSELDMLKGSRHLLASRSIDYLFISTHSSELHEGCARLIEQHGYRILASVDLEDSYSFDGILVVCNPAVTPPPFKLPSRKPKKINQNRA